jgi:hypothetical protein
LINDVELSAVIAKCVVPVTVMPLLLGSIALIEVFDILNAYPLVAEITIDS